MEVAEFHAAVVAVDLEADAAGLENFRGEIVFGGGLLAVYPDGATSTLDADLEEEPAALEIGLERTALAGVEGAGLVDGIDGGVDLDLEAAVGALGLAAEEDAGVDAVVRADHGGELKIVEDGGRIEDGVAVEALDDAVFDAPLAAVAALAPGFERILRGEIKDAGARAGEVLHVDVAERVGVTHVGEADAAEAEAVGEGGDLGHVEFLEDYVVDGDLAEGAAQFDLDGVPLVEGGREDFAGGQDAHNSAGDPGGGFLVVVVGEGDGKAGVLGAIATGGAQDDGGLGPLGEFVFEAEAEILVIGIGEDPIAGLAFAGGAQFALGGGEGGVGALLLPALEVLAVEKGAGLGGDGDGQDQQGEGSQHVFRIAAEGV